METSAISGCPGAEGVQRNHLRPDLGLPGKSDITRPGDLDWRMGLIAGEVGWLVKGKGGCGVVREVRGHQSGGRADAGTAARPVVQPLEQLWSLEVVTEAEAVLVTRAQVRLIELLVGDVVREECVVVGNNPGYGDTGPPGDSRAVTVIVVESCPWRFRNRVGFFCDPGGVKVLFPHWWKTAAAVKNGINIVGVWRL